MTLEWVAERPGTGERHQHAEAPLKFTDVYVCTTERFSIGVEETSGRLYVAIPVSNPFVDYEEYYEIDRSQFALYQKDLRSARLFVSACRRHEKDDLLIIPPGASRGVPT